MQQNSQILSGPSESEHSPLLKISTFLSSFEVIISNLKVNVHKAGQSSMQFCGKTMADQTMV
jgi:hypothetical protein